VESHRQAGQRLIAAKDALFDELSDNLRAGTAMNEYSVQQRFLALIEQLGLVQADVHVAVNANISNPHYGPTREQHSPIQRGDLILFDFWAHMPEPKAIYADYTWMAFAGTREEIPHRYFGIFDIVTRARDAAISFVRKQLEAGQRVQGCQVDDVARRVIADAGYADYFVHRTGHSIDTVVHGNGANIDNFETQDERILLPSTCCSIEPGIYLPEFGVRSEVDLLIHEHDAEVTGTPIQEEIVALL
jgi:Xaa-Pro aminopeptidase